MKLSAAERRTSLIRRPWTKAERAVVTRGFWGRASIAIEPILGSVVFFAIAAGMCWRAYAFHDWSEAVGLLAIGAIFALGFLAFVAYTVVVMVAPVRALLETAKPIFIVDGYIRTRDRDAQSDEQSNGYVAVLAEDRMVLAEWAARGSEPLESLVRPALVEFSDFGGIHRIDGLSTGVLPEKLTLLGIGMVRN